MKKIMILLFFCISISFTSDNSNEIVNINGQKFEIKILGQGKLTIIFENGMATTLDTWKSIEKAFENDSKLLLYNRAGLGKSDTALTKRTLPNIVLDLKNLLEYKKINPPYIIIAHSMGGYIARFFTVKYSYEVVGLVLIDPSAEILYDNYTEQEYKDFKSVGDNTFKNAIVGEKREWENYLENRKYLHNQPIPANIPICIISATQWDFYKFQDNILNKNKNSKHFKLEGGHYIHNEKPDSVISIIKTFMKDIK